MQSSQKPPEQDSNKINVHGGRNHADKLYQNELICAACKQFMDLMLKPTNPNQTSIEIENFLSTDSEVCKELDELIDATEALPNQALETIDGLFLEGEV